MPRLCLQLGAIPEELQEVSIPGNPLHLWKGRSQNKPLPISIDKPELTFYFSPRSPLRARFHVLFPPCFLAPTTHSLAWHRGAAAAGRGAKVSPTHPSLFSRNSHRGSRWAGRTHSPHYGWQGTLLLCQTSYPCASASNHQAAKCARGGLWRALGALFCSDPLFCCRTWPQRKVVGSCAWKAFADSLFLLRKFSTHPFLKNGTEMVENNCCDS